MAKDIYEGDKGKQIAAIWKYMEDGNKAKVPNGVLGGIIELKPTDRPIIYRNFIEGLSPRAIAVGYPEGANIGWDASSMSLGLIWHGRFIDAAKHWQGRGQGNQDPLGDHSFKWQKTAAVAELPSRDTPWPETTQRDNGYRFLGYRLDKQGRPSFRYKVGDVEITDQLTAFKAKPDAILQRRLSATTSADNLYVRIATGKVIEQSPDGYRVDNTITIELETDQQPFIRSANGRQELLVPLTGEVAHRIHW